MVCVDGVDVVVGGGRDRDRTARRRVRPIQRSAMSVEVVVEGAGDDPAVGLVGVEGARVAVSQLQRGGGFPRVGEAVDAVELVDPAGGAQLGEQAAAPDGLQLAGVTDEREPPAVPVGEVDEAVEVGGAEHPGLVDDHRRAGGSRYRSSGARSVRSHSWSSLATVSAAMPVSRSRTRAAFAVGATPNTGRSEPCEVVDGAASMRGLAGPGRADHQHQPVVAGDRRGGVGLQHVEPGRDDRRRRRRLVGLGVHRPGEDRFLLGQDRSLV